MIRRLVVHPFLLAAYPILWLYSNNVSEASPGELVGPIALVLGASGLIWGGAFGLLRNARKAGLVTSILLVLFFGLSPVQEGTNQLLYYLSTFWVPYHGPIRSANYVFAAMALLSLAACYLVVGRLKDTGPLTGILNVFSIALTLAAMVSIVWASSPSLSGEHARWNPRPITRLEEPATKPDIYYIILDTYARRDVMKALFDFDIQPFLDRLERKGFYIADQATANYCQTRLCLSSSLNAQYIDEIARGRGNDLTGLAECIGRNNVIETLRPLGYKYVSFSSGFAETEHPRSDLYLTPSYLPFTGFQRLLITTTPFGSLLPVPKSLDRFETIRERVLYALEHLPDVADDPESTFTFAHFMCPHPPFLFGENGEDIRDRDNAPYRGEGKKFDGLTSETNVYQRGFRDQSIFITKRIEETIDRILAKSKTPPIILLQSDHGSGMNLDTSRLEKTDLMERMTILSASYFPERRYDRLYESISPVNTFRVVFNTFFGANLSLLADRSFFSTWEEPYKFYDVTRQVAGKEYTRAPPHEPADIHRLAEPSGSSGRSDPPIATPAAPKKPVGGDARSDDSQSGD